MKKTLLLVVATILIFGTGVVTMGQLEIAPEAPDFSEVDMDQDGSLSRDEAALVEGLDFDIADKDRNGILSKEEYNAAMVGGAIILEPMEEREPTE
ncbi:hypothetical protein [Nitrosococcus wardiae]|uniref:EF-hand domain-containing protein n=1 Tax=Nitrosococcus wardiae TaxID=1814290 RepID=A0A4P7BYI4_9GAMM|nr:hypothetical protein [Nitrosococcus wardiae]QBQ54299.1 hypothetical protein E3U44_07100 [Nitrosococcus wardiae]